MKKILLYTRPIIPPWDEASKNLAYEIACHCDDQGCQFCVLTTKEARLPIGRLTESSSIVLENIYSSAQLNFPEKLQLLLRLFRFPLQADIIHFMFTPRALTSWLIKFRLLFTSAKIIQTIATVNENLYQNPEKLKKIFFADKIVAQSKFTKEKLTAAGLENVEFIYPGIDLETFRPAEKNSTLMNQLGITAKDVVFLFAGELSRISGVDDIIEAFRLIKEKIPTQDHKLIIACRIKSSRDQEKRQQLGAKVNELGLADQVIFYDKVTDITALYNLSDVNIFYVNEMTGKVDVPFVVIEAMACAKPVVVSDLPVLQEIIQDQQTGLVAKKNNSLDLAEKILQLIQDQTKRISLGQQALALAKENFDIKKTVKKYEAIYRQL